MLYQKMDGLARIEGMRSNHLCQIINFYIFKKLLFPNFHFFVNL
jgi:hypothetical protein